MHEEICVGKFKKAVGNYDGSSKGSTNHHHRRPREDLPTLTCCISHFTEHSLCSLHCMLFSRNGLLKKFET
ncbi:hypothetical protein vseg_000463 [Gypsophila vaccaria]